MDINIIDQIQHLIEEYADCREELDSLETARTIIKLVGLELFRMAEVTKDKGKITLEGK